MCLFSVQSSAHTALQECEKMFADMIRSIERMQQEMMKLISSNKRAALSNAEGHVERLSHEISDLKRRDNEITQLSRTEDHIHFIQVTDNRSTDKSNTLSTIRDRLLNRPTGLKQRQDDYKGMYTDQKK